MPIHFACPSCKTTYTVDDKHAGKKSNCARCGQRLQVPTPMPVRNKTILGDFLPVAKRAAAAENDDPEPIPLTPRREVSDDDGSAAESPASDGVPFYGYCPPIPKSRNWAMPMVAIGGAIGVLLVFGIVVILLVRGCDSGGSSFFGSLSGDKDGDLLPWAPPNSEVVVGINVDEVLSVREIGEQAKGKRDSLNLGKVERVIVAARGSKGDKDSVSIHRVAKPFDPNALVRSGRAKVKKRGSQQYLELANEGKWVFNPTANVVVEAESEKALFQSMDGKAGEIRISADLRKAYRSADGPVAGAAVGMSAQQGSFTSPLALLFEKNPEPPPFCQSQVLSTKVRSDRSDVRFECTYSDSTKAKLAATQIESGMKKAMAMAVAGARSDDEGVYLLRVIYDTFKVEASGDSVTITFQLPHKELKRLKYLD